MYRSKRESSCRNQKLYFEVKKKRFNDGCIEKKLIIIPHYNHTPLFSPSAVGTPFDAESDDVSFEERIHR